MENLIPCVFLVVTYLIIAWSLSLQRKALAQQKQAMNESFALSRKQVENQETIIALLEQIRDRTTS